MERILVESSNVKSVGYEDEVLQVEFHRSGVYEYYGVPQDVYQRLLKAESVGKFINTCVKGIFTFRKVQ